VLKGTPAMRFGAACRTSDNSNICKNRNIPGNRQVKDTLYGWVFGTRQEKVQKKPAFE